VQVRRGYPATHRGLAVLALAAAVVVLLGGCGAPPFPAGQSGPTVVSSPAVPAASIYTGLTPAAAQALLPFHLVVPGDVPSSLTLHDIRVQIAPLPRGETPAPHRPPRFIATILYRAGNGRPDVGLDESLLDLRPPATASGQPPLHNALGTAVPLQVFPGTTEQIVVAGQPVVRTVFQRGTTGVTVYSWQRAGVYFSLTALSTSGASAADVERLVVAAIQ